MSPRLHWSHRETLPKPPKPKSLKNCRYLRESGKGPLCIERYRPLRPFDSLPGSPVEGNFKSLSYELEPTRLSTKLDDSAWRRGVRHSSWCKGEGPWLGYKGDEFLRLSVSSSTSAWKLLSPTSWPRRWTGSASSRLIRTINHLFKLTGPKLLG